MLVDGGEARSCGAPCMDGTRLTRFPHFDRRFSWVDRLSRVGIVAFSAAVIAAMVVAVMVGPFGDQVLARDGWSNRDHDGDGIVHALFGIPAPQAPIAAQGLIRTATHPAWRRTAWVPGHAGRTHRQAALRMAADRPVQLARHSVCVRLCDGFYFPVGDVHDRQDLASQTATCSNICPGAPTRLYVVPSGDSDIDKATSTTNGQPYTALPVAYAHTGSIGPTCGCREPGQDQATMVSPLKDFTLRSGDSIMTPIGWQVFKGADHWPYRRGDFSRVASATNLTPKTRSALTSMENASMVRHVATRLPEPRPITIRQRVAGSAPTMNAADGQMVRLVGSNLSYTR